MDIRVLTYKEELMDMAHKYCRLTGTSLGALGKLVVKDADFFKRISNGGGCNIKTLKKVLIWFGENMPRRTNK